jgi:hypothetical protein
MFSFLASSTFFKYAQNAGFAFKKIQNFHGGDAPNPSTTVRLVDMSLHSDQGQKLTFIGSSHLGP